MSPSAPTRRRRFIAWTAVAALGLALAAPPARGDDAAEWTGWRGPARDGCSPDTGLLRQWPDRGPKLLWRASGIGDGYSSVAVARGRIYTLGDAGEDCYLFCIRAEDGKKLWATRVNAAGTHKQYNGPRSTPATDGEIVVALGETGDLLCADAKTGAAIWSKHMERDFGGRVMSRWKWAESPLLDGGLVVVTPGGGENGVVALSRKDGSKVWSAALPDDKAAYTSLVPAEIGGVRQYLVLTDRSVAGIDARKGAVLWRAAREGKTAVAASPVHRDGIVFVSSGYKVGCNGFAVKASDGRFAAEEVYSGRQLANHHGGCIGVGDHVWGVDDGGSIKCLELKTGREVWASPRLGKGSLAWADGLLIYRSEDRRDGTVVLLEASPEGYQEKGRFEPPARSGQPAWSHPAISGGKLYLRDQGVLLCYELKGK